MQFNVLEKQNQGEDVEGKLRKHQADAISIKKNIKS